VLASCGGDQYVPEKVPRQLESVELPLSKAKVEEILASDNATALIDAVKENQSAYEAATKTNYAKLTALDPCVKRVDTVVSAPLSNLLYWDDQKNGFFKKKISIQKPVLTKFGLEFALPINSGGRVPAATAFEFPLTVDSVTNPSGDYKNFVIEAYPYWVRDFYIVQVPVGAFMVYPKKGSGIEYAILTPASNILTIDICPK